MLNGQKRIVGTIWLVLFSVFLVILAQDYAGGPLSKTIPLDLGEKTILAGESVRMRLPERYRDELTAERIVILENGVPLPIRAASIRAVTKKGFGRYRANPGYVYFSGSDNTSPLENGREYAMLVPHQVKPPVKWILLTLLTAMGFFLLRGEGQGKLGRPPTDTAIATGIAILATIIGLYHLKADAGISSEFMLIKGKPYSDAGGWLELGRSLDDGRGFTGGFSSHRPFYPLFLGSVFTFFGQSLLVAKLANIALLIMAASFGFLFGAFCGSRIVGIAIALWILFDPAANLLVHQTLSEGLGFALGVSAAYILAIAFQKGTRSCFFIGGVLFAMSNLARPFWLLGAFFFGLIFLFLLIRKDEWPLKRILHTGLLFSAGILIVMFPWSLRQKIVNGTWSPSINSSIMLYAGAAPDVGHTHALNSAHYAEGEEEGLIEYTRDWNTFFVKRYRDTVAEDPGQYLKRVAHYTLAFFDEFSLNQPWRKVFLLISVCLVIAWQSWRYGSPLTFLVMPVAVLGIPPLCKLPTLALILISAAVLLFSPKNRQYRTGAALALSLLLGAAVLNGMIANFALNRSAVLASWLVFYLAFAAITHLIRITTLPDKVPDTTMPAWNRFSKVTLGIYFAIVVAGLAIMGIRTSLGSMEPKAPEVPDLIADELFQNASLRNYELTQQLIRIGDYRMPLGANEDTGHVSPIFAPREQPRIVVFPRLIYPNGYPVWSPVHFTNATPNQLPRGKTFVLVAIKHEIKDDFDRPLAVWEAVSLTPYDPKTETIDKTARITFPIAEESLTPQ